MAARYTSSQDHQSHQLAKDSPLRVPGSFGHYGGYHSSRRSRMTLDGTAKACWSDGTSCCLYSFLFSAARIATSKSQAQLQHHDHPKATNRKRRGGRRLRQSHVTVTLRHKFAAANSMADTTHISYPRPDSPPKALPPPTPVASSSGPAAPTNRLYVGNLHSTVDEYALPLLSCKPTCSWLVLALDPRS